MKYSFCVLGAAAALAAAGPAAASAVVEAQGERARVRFAYRPPADQGAREVLLAGSFNHWKPDPAWALRDDDGDGRFEGSFELPPGRHLYKFVVDGERWAHDPEQAEREPDGHGGFNSVLELGAEGRAPGGAPQSASPFGHTRTRPQGPQGFVGEVFFLEPGTQRLPDFRGRRPEGKIYTQTLNVAPQPFDRGFPGLSDRFEWFAIRYRGTFHAERKGHYRLRLLSDDGARVYLDGRLVLDNDGLHGPRSVTRILKLDKGDYRIVVDYMQGPALEVALQLYVMRPNSTQEELLRAGPPAKGTRSRRRRRSR